MKSLATEVKISKCSIDEHDLLTLRFDARVGKSHLPEWVQDKLAFRLKKSGGKILPGEIGRLITTEFHTFLTNCTYVLDLRLYRNSNVVVEPSFHERVKRLKRTSAFNWDIQRKDKLCKERNSALVKAIDDYLVASHEASVALVPLYQAMFNDIGAPWNCFQYLSRRIKSEGWHFVSTILPSLEKTLLSGLSSGKLAQNDNFFSPKGQVYPRFLQSLWAQVFEKDGTLKGVGVASPIAVQQIRQILGFAYKATVPCGPDKEEAAVQQFISTENELANFVQSDSIDWDDDPILDFGSRVIEGMFADYEEVRSTLKFRHGPGVTANIPTIQKFEAPLSRFPSVREFGDSFFFNERDENERMGRYKPMSHRGLFSNNEKPTAAIKLVPKDARGPRIISAEPFENQWVQQGIRGYMYDRIETHPLTGGHLNFTDQTVNRALACKASITREFSTLDLKEASDRVSYKLVESLFSRTTLLWDLVWSRSVATKLPDGTVLDLAKFAPMGSALCFPVLALSIYMILFAGLVGVGFPPEQAKGMIYVYGDDVIVSTRYANYCVALLERYGLLVNKNKSFIDSRFAESCGMDCFDGNDVSIVRLKQCPNLSKKIQNPEILVSLVETANGLDPLGYDELAELIYTSVESGLGLLPYGYSHSRFLCRRMAQHRGSSAIVQTAKRLKFRFTNLKLTDELVYACKAPVVISNETEYAETSLGGHLLRIWPVLDGPGEGLPLAGEFDVPRSYVIKHDWMHGADFSEYLPNKWVPSVPNLPWNGINAYASKVYRWLDPVFRASH